MIASLPDDWPGPAKVGRALFSNGYAESRHAPAVAAVIPLVNQLLGGRALTPIEFVALVLGPCALGAVYILGRSMIKAEMVRAGAQGGSS